MFTKKINRRKFLIMAGTASSAAILVACAPQTQATVNPAPTAVSARIPLEMLMTGEDDNAVHRTAFTIYKDLHPEIDLTISPVPGGFPDLYAKVNARVAAGNPPDMMQLCSYGPVVTWAKKKILLDLKPYTTSDPDFKDNPIPQSLLNSFIQGGELFGIPKDYVPHAAIYNKTLLDQAGVEVPKDGWTWADVVDKAQKLTTGTGTDKIYGWMSPTAQWWIEYYMMANGGPSYFNRKTNDFSKPTADDPKNIEAMQWLYDTIQKYKISPSAEQLGSMDSSTRQISGKLAMWHSMTIDTVTLMQNQDKIDWHVVPLPRAYADGPVATIEWTSGFGTFSATKSPDECWEFLKHMSIGEGAVVLGSTGFSIPSGRPDAFLSSDMVARGGQVFLDVAKNADVATDAGLGEYNDEILNQVITPTTEAFFLGKVTATDLMKQIQKGMEDILAANPA